MCWPVDLHGIPTEMLVSELERRRVLPRCQCGKWKTYVASYDRDGNTLRCSGCKRATHACTC